MNKLLPLLCAALILVPVGAEAGQRVSLGAGLGLAGIVKVSAGFDQRWGKHHGGGDNNGDGQQNNNGDGNGHRGGWGDGDNGQRGGEQRDNRINRAMQIASSRGRVLDAWPMGGSIFGVRVATDHGRVDLTVDTDSGQIIGEH